MAAQAPARRRTTTAALLAIIAAALTLAGCARVERQSTQPEPIRLLLSFVPNIQFAPFYVAAERGYFAEAGLEVVFEHVDESQAVKLVATGETPFAVVSGEQVLLARAQGLPVVYVAAWWQEYPVVIVARADTGIDSPEDLQGAQIGIPMLEGASYIGLRALLDAGGVTEAEVRLNAIGFTQVEALAAGREQAVVGYVTNEPIQLRERGYPVRVIRVADHVKLVSNGLVTSEQVLREQPALVEAMVAAVLRGIEQTITAPEQAFEVSKRFVDELDQADPAIQRAVLAASIDLWKTDRLGYSDLDAWENMQQILLEIGLLSEPQDLTEAFTNDFLP